LNKCRFCEESYNENDHSICLHSGYCSKLCKEIDEVDFNE